MSTTLIETPTFEVLPPDVATASNELSCPTDKVAALYAPFQKPFEAAADLLAEEEKATSAFDARTLRLRMVKARTTITSTKDESKSDIKLAGNIIDWFHAKGRDRLAAAESRLLEIEKAEERAEAARIESLREERAETLESMGHDWHSINLGGMSDDAWNVYLTQAKDVYEMREIRKKREAEEAAAELVRQEAEREAQRLENIRLRDEADKARAEAKAIAEAAEIERQKANAEIVRQQAAAKVDRERAAADAAEERRKAIEAAAIEAKKREKAEAEAKALRDAEAKRIADQAAKEAAQAKADAAAAKKAAAAPDKQRLLEFAIAVRNMPVPPVKSEVANEVRDDITAKLESFAKWIEASVSVL